MNDRDDILQKSIEIKFCFVIINFPKLFLVKNTFGGQKKGYIIVFVRWNDPDEHTRHDLGDFGRIKEPCKANVNL